VTDFADWKQQARGERVPVEVCMDREVLGEYERAIEDFGSARADAKGMLDLPAAVTEAAERLRDLDDKVQQATRTFWMVKIPRGDWMDLEEAHPATDAQKEDNPKQRLDPETFEPAIVAACCDEPTLTVDDAIWLRDFLPGDEWYRLIDAVGVANQRGSQVPKGASVIVGRLATELKSITPANEASLSPSSEDES
jgi:hypothetical protein